MPVLLALGTRKGLWLATSDDRRTWTLGPPHHLGQEVAAVAIDPRGGRVRLLAATASEHWGPSVAWSDDRGETWHERKGGAIRFPADTGAALARVWQLQPDSPDRPGVVWAGCEPTSLWRSDDHGETFALVRGLWDHPHRPDWVPGYGGAAVHTVVPAAESPEVLVAMSTGGVYASADGSQDWTPRNRGIAAPFLPGPDPEYGQCVHKVTAAGRSLRRLYAQNHGGVYRSDDGGLHWQSISAGLPADFGFPVLASPRDPDTAWVVPLSADSARFPPHGQLRVHRTRDGGRTWTAFGSGLPDDSWSVVLRDAACLDDLDPAGVYVGTRDGSVYASADEGESWTAVAEHLPDVLCVRAAVLD